MALPKYRLEPVLEKKRRRRDAAQEALAEAQSALKKEEEKKQQLLQELENLKQERLEARRRRQEKMLTDGMTGLGAGRVQEFVDGTEFRERQKKEEILEQESAIDKARLRVEEQKLILTEAAKEVQAMEKHKEEWIAKIKKEIAAKEAKEMDEIGTAIHLQRKRQQEG